MSNAVVTGAGGFVGSAVVRALCLHGWDVYAIVRPGGSIKLPFPLSVRVIECDAHEMDRLPGLLPRMDEAVFFHFAWTGSSGPQRSDEHIQLQNAADACASVRAAKALHCSRYIFAGSIMQYELMEKVRFARPIPPSGVYAAGKLAASCMASATANRIGLPFFEAIISHIYGPNDNPERLVAGIVLKLLSGVHVPLTAGTQDYDFIYLDDAADAFAALAEGNLQHTAYYIGTEPRPLKEYLLEAGRALRAESLLGFGEIPFTDVPVRFSDLYQLSALHEDTGFVPNVPFADGILRLAAHIREENKGE